MPVHTLQSDVRHSPQGATSRSNAAHISPALKPRKLGDEGPLVAILCVGLQSRKRAVDLCTSHRTPNPNRLPQTRCVWCVGMEYVRPYPIGFGPEGGIRCVRFHDKAGNRPVHVAHLDDKHVLLMVEGLPLEIRRQLIVPPVRYEHDVKGRQPHEPNMG